MKFRTIGFLFFLFAVSAFGQVPSDLQQFIRVNAPMIALTNVRVIDGTGVAPLENQTILIENGKISLVGPTAATTFPGGTRTLDLPGYTVLPGLVGMHNHLFFPRAATHPSTRTWASVFPAFILHSV